MRLLTGKVGQIVQTICAQILFHVEIMTKLPVTQSKKNIVMATAALTSPTNSYTHKICTIVKQLNRKIHSQRSLI